MQKIATEKMRQSGRFTIELTTDGSLACATHNVPTTQQPIVHNTNHRSPRSFMTYSNNTHLARFNSWRWSSMVLKSGCS